MPLVFLPALRAALPPIPSFPPEPMADSQTDSFARKLEDRLTDLRLRADLREITSAAAFRAALEQDGVFRLADPRVLAACERAGFRAWTG